MLFEADYAKNYASIMYQCLTNIHLIMSFRVKNVVFNSDEYSLELDEDELCSFR